MQSETKFVELVIVNDNSQVSHVAGNKVQYFICLLLKDQGLVSRKTQKLFRSEGKFYIKTCWIVVQFLAHKQFCFGTDGFVALFSKLLKLECKHNKHKTAFRAQKVIGTFEKRAQICDPRFDFSTYPDEILFAKFEKLSVVDSEPVHLSVVY